VLPAQAPKETHTHLVLDLDDGKAQLRFRDVRRFGCALVLERASDLEDFFLDRQLGPEPFDLLKDAWRSELGATRRCLKAALLDQQLVAGVGNIYADEALFEARLPPTQLGCDTSPEQADRLRRAIVKVLSRAIEQRGSSIRDYLDGNGQAGGYQREFRVYDRTGEPCSRCRAPIERIRLAGRSTHYCPSCQQPLPLAASRSLAASVNKPRLQASAKPRAAIRS
jgi:formamidopyrimidine-DNA glycosylase